MKNLKDYKVTNPKKPLCIILSFLGICIILSLGNAYMKQQNAYKQDVIELKETLKTLKISSDKEIKKQNELVVENRREYAIQLAEVLEELKIVNKTLENLNGQLSKQLRM